MILQVFGNVKNPLDILAPGKYPAGTNGEGLITLLNALLKLAIVGAGVYALLNFIFAGYGFMSAGDDPKKITHAFDKFWQSLVGLLFVAGAFVLAAVFGYLIFGDATAILNPRIFGPGQ